MKLERIGQIVLSADLDSFIPIVQRDIESLETAGDTGRCVLRVQCMQNGLITFIRVLTETEMKEFEKTRGTGKSIYSRLYTISGATPTIAKSMVSDIMKAVI